MKSKTDSISSVFWILIVFYLDPGGYVGTYLPSVLKSIIMFGSAILAWICFAMRYHKKENLLVNPKFMSSYIIFILIWLSYYFIWFYGLNNDFYEGPLKSIVRNARIIGLPLLVIPIAYFASIKLDFFVKVLIWSTILILSGLIVSVFLGIPIVPFWEVYRSGASGVKRILMHSEGIIYLSLPMAISMLLLKYKVDRKIIISALLVFIYIFFLSLFRRNMIGLLEYIIILSLLVNYIYGRNPIVALKRFINFKSVILIIFTIVVLSFAYPKFITTMEKIAENTYSVVVLGQSTDGVKDTRVSLTGNAAIISAIINNFWGGTGFHPNWLTGDGGDKKWEGADYIFLASLAMYGIIGLLIFLPFYIIVGKIIVSFLRLVKQHFVSIKENDYLFFFPIIIGLSCSAEFIKNMIEYPNWFHPIATLDNSGAFYIYLGLLLGSHYYIQKKIILIKVSENED